jgi:hypothetical protein
MGGGNRPAPPPPPPPPPPETPALPAPDTAGLVDAVAAANAKRRRRGRGSIITSGLGTAATAVTQSPTLGVGGETLGG